MNKSQTNALGDVAESLQTFDLIDLEQYTREKKYSANASKEFHLFYAGRANDPTADFEFKPLKLRIGKRNPIAIKPPGRYSEHGRDLNRLI